MSSIFGLGQCEEKDKLFGVCTKDFSTYGLIAASGLLAVITIISLITSLITSSLFSGKFKKIMKQCKVLNLSPSAALSTVSTASKGSLATKK